MIYELRINIYVEFQHVLEDVLDKLDDLKPQMKVIKPGQPDQQCSTIEVMENHHDMTPPDPCSQISHWDNCPS